MLKDRPTASEVLTVLNEIGIDASENIRTQLTPELMEKADVVVSMAEEDTLPEYVIQSDKVRYWNLPDPFQQSLEFTRESRDKITALVKDLLATHLK